jgi:hypothetical protein
MALEAIFTNLQVKAPSQWTKWLKRCGKPEKASKMPILMLSKKVVFTYYFK